MPTDEIPILVDMSPPRSLGSTTVDTLDGIGTDVVKVSKDVLGSNLKSMLQGLESILGSENLQLKSFDIGQLKVGLHIDAGGNVSLLGIAKADIGGKATFEIVLIPK